MHACIIRACCTISSINALLVASSASLNGSSAEAAFCFIHLHSLMHASYIINHACFINSCIHSCFIQFNLCMHACIIHACCPISSINALLVASAASLTVSSAEAAFCFIQLHSWMHASYSINHACFIYACVRTCFNLFNLCMHASFMHAARSVALTLYW